MITSTNILRTELEAIATDHQQINTFFWGDLLRAWKEQEVEYPLMCAYYPNGALFTNQTELQIVVIICDKHYKDWNINLNEVESDTLQIARDVFQTMNMSTRWQKILRIDSCSVGKFINDTGDEVAGHTLTFTVRLRDTSGICGLPMGDYDFEQSPALPSGDCADANWTLKDSASVDISTGTIASGASANITAPDATVTLNSGAFNDYESGSTNDIILQDQDSNPITPDSVVGNTITVTTGGAGLDTKSATLLKTNQTVSYRTGDDADRQEGRATDFFTLPANNPFGNLNRFTDETGAQTYTNNIVIDWSTYDGSTVLGYDKRDQGLSIWDDAIDNALAHSTGGFSSGWYLPNVNEIMNLFDLGQSQRLNYAPFNLSSMTLWSSSSQTSTQSWSPVSTGNTILARGSKTGSRKSIYARQFTNAELGI